MGGYCSSSPTNKTALDVLGDVYCKDGVNNWAKQAATSVYNTYRYSEASGCL